MPFPKEGRKGTSSRMVSGKFKNVGPLISSGMMRKLEPVLQYKFDKRAVHCHPLVTIKPLNNSQDNTQTKKRKDQDVFCFPSSPRKVVKREKYFKRRRKKVKKMTKKAAKKTKKVLKRYANKEVLATIRNTREHIQLLRSQLQDKQELIRQDFSDRIILE
ncbi:hypothetical protein OS493_039477 [Desmophyllum pertusum]|uniref:Uncharacterized protein n=1 Tax=Desmophyllum pertusum TaxID=174260 RepID=A0A9W9ZY70_9CNID|nr:hypothetical protein OS493_039477 [Desmophyllum pertusum]